MRHLNDFEKDIIRRIVYISNNIDNPNYASVIDHLLVDKEVVLNFTNRSVSVNTDIRFYQQDTLIEEVQKITLELVTTINLLEELEKFGYVLTFLEAKPNNPTIFGQFVRGNTPVQYDLVDERIINLLLDYSVKTIIVRPSLQAYVTNNFKTNEEIKEEQERISQAVDLRINKRNLKIAMWALIISIVLGIYEIYLGHQEVKYGKMQVEQEQDVKLNDRQLQDLTNKIESTSKQVELTTKQIEQSNNKIDTLTKVIKKKKPSH